MNTLHTIALYLCDVLLVAALGVAAGAIMCKLTQWDEEHEG